MAVQRVVLIRPGETSWNGVGRWQGWVAVPLNEHGREQAQALARLVRNIGLSALYSSDLTRAVETAALLAEPLGFDPVYDSRLRERSIGHWQGLTLREIRDWYPDEYRALQADPENYVVPGGESRHQVKQRVVAAFDEIVAQNDGETVGVLSHTTSIKALLQAIIPVFDLRGLELENTSVTTIMQAMPGVWRIVAQDDVTHLEGLASRSVPEVEETDDDSGH